MNATTAGITAILLSASAPAYAQDNARAEQEETHPFAFGVVGELYSKQLGEKRVLNIYLPEGYSPDSTTTYPVIYLLDGSVHEDYAHIAGLVEFMSTYELMPRSIVVGIANVDRQRDFTHPSSVPEDLKAAPTSGGSAKFIAFLEKELQPYVEAHYRTAPRKTLIGQSLGGLLATEILLHDPELFDEYIIVSPSFWWNKGSLVNEAAPILQAHPDLATKVYISVGTEGDEMRAGVDELVHAFNTFGTKCRVWYVPFPEETHATILHRSVYKAFELLNKPQ